MPGATADAVERLSEIRQPAIRMATGTGPCSTFVENGVREPARSVRRGATAEGENQQEGNAVNPAEETTRGFVLLLGATEDVSRPGGTRTPDKGIMSPLL